MKTWFWLEDLQDTVSDLERVIMKVASEQHVTVEHFENISELQERLLLLSKSEPDTLGDSLLILDVMLGGHTYIDCPKEWSGTESTRFRTREGYDAGLVFYEGLVLKHPLKSWRECPPPVVFLTARQADQEERQHLDRICEAYAKSCGIDEEQTKVRWISKGESNSTSAELRQVLEEISGDQSQ